MKINYQHVLHCPLCESEGILLGTLSIEKYQFGRYFIDLPDEGVQLMRCSKCTLHYKTQIPTKEALSQLFTLVAKDVWVGKQLSFKHEIELISRCLPKNSKELSLIDIGSSDGSFLNTIKQIVDLRSACDVYLDPRCESAVNGEYIMGFIEDPDLRHKHKYDVISMFDVLEHLYSPNLAFQSIDRLGKTDSLVILETGDISTVHQPCSWWYVNYIEHHIFWTRSALQALAASYNYKIIYFEGLPHKGRRYMPYFKRIVASVLFGMRKIGPLRKAIFLILKLRIEMIGNPFERDHMLVILRRELPFKSHL